MNKKLKKELISVFAAPAPIKKEAFLCNMNYPKTKPYEFMIKQLGYIRMRNWICSLTIFLISFYSLFHNDQMNALYKTFGFISSLFPFIAFLTVTEITRSSAYQMTELEMTTRYNLSEIVLSRLVLLGTVNLLLFLITTLLFTSKAEYSFVRTGIYLTVPYLLTSNTSLIALRLLRSRESIYISSIFCILTSYLCNISFLQKVIYQSRYFLIWIFLFLLLSTTIFIQTKRLIKKSEDFLWNSFSTV